MLLGITERKSRRDFVPRRWPVATQKTAMEKFFGYASATVVVLACFLFIGAYAINPHDAFARQAGPGALALSLAASGFGIVLNRSRGK